MPKTEKGTEEIVVSFRRGTSAQKILELVAAQNCTLHNNFDGSARVNIVLVPAGKRQEMIDRFKALPEVERAYSAGTPTFF